jgi:hypothetical protein
MNKFAVAVCFIASLAACKPSSPKWSWNGLSLGMPSQEAAPIVQRLCGADQPLKRKEFPQAQTWIIGCDATQAELEGQRVAVTAQFYQDKLLVVSLAPPAETPKEWWDALEKKLDAKYGAGTNDDRSGQHAREWKPNGEWIRTHDNRSIAFAEQAGMKRRSEAAAKLQKATGKTAPTPEE